jgi:hypothetical protein
MARLGCKWRFDTKSEYRQLLLPGIGTLDACRTVGTGRKSGCRWRADNGGLALVESLGRMAGSEPGFRPCRCRLALVRCHCSIVASTRPAETASSSRR